jgi:Ca2+-binding RTX toxin-like protein
LKRRKLGASLVGEQLESRTLLSANQISFDASNSAVVIEGTTGNDWVNAFVDASNVLHVSLQNAIGNQSSTFNAGNVAEIRFLAGDGDDYFSSSSFISTSLSGGNGNDNLFGGVGQNYIDGGAGNDKLYASGGADQLIGGDGDDLLDAGAGNDTLNGGIGKDTLLGGDGDDFLYGEDGADLLAGGSGGDTISGGIGNDELYGGTGNDGLYGNEGDDNLYGEEGNDYLNGVEGNDLLKGGVGDDILDGSSGNDTLLGEDGNDTLYAGYGAEYLSGGAGNDYLQGGAENDLLYGDAGNDLLEGDDGDDNLYGGDGGDSLTGDAGNDYLEGGNENDQLFGGIGNDTLDAGIGDDQLYGDDGADLLKGGAGYDLLRGGAGIDQLYGGTENDTLFGDDGDDNLYGEDGNDTLNGGNGNDSLRGSIGSDVLYGDAGDDALFGQEDSDVLYGGDGNDTLDGYLGNDRLYAGDGADTLLGGDGNDVLFGEAGNDLLKGEAGNDVLQGGADRDILYGGIGRDSLSGNDGDDDLFGDEDNDVLSGGNGTDLLYGGVGNDALSGNDGNDTLYGGDGDDLQAGGAGNDFIYGEYGNDNLYGGAGDDLLVGEWGDDVLLGEEGNDNLTGDDGNDEVVGGVGNDQLYAGAGTDLLIGGLGTDLLRGDDGDDILLGGTSIYDRDVAKLRAIGSAWSTATPYAVRAAQISDQLFAAYLKTEETFFDDSVADTLYGGNQQDWFLLSGYVSTYRPADVEPYVPDGSMEGHHPTKIINTLPPVEGFNYLDSIDKMADRQSTESVATIVPEVDSSSLQREHLSLYQLVRYDQVTHYAVSSGNWSNPATWHDGVVPAAGARVLIPIGVKVQVDNVVPARLNTIRVDGTLSFKTNVNTELKVDTVVVTDSGRFEMGTEAAPIANNVTSRLLITDNGAIDRVWDPFAISRGLITQGSVSIYGAAVTSFASLAGLVTSGTQTLTLKSLPTGWKIGDSVVIASTVNGQPAQNETRRIASIVANVVILDQPLIYNHLTPSLDIDVQIANTTRNAVIESEGTAIDRRGHVMFMHDRDVHIAYGGFYSLGRTDKSKPINDAVVDSNWALKPGTGTNVRARYSVHFHRNGVTNDGAPATVLGSAVVDNPGWGYVNHDSYVNMTNNVAVGVNGSAFATEVGNEIGGFYGNLAIGTTGTDELADARKVIQDFGFNGDGFWFQGAGIDVVGNIAAGNHNAGFTYYTRGLIQGGFETPFQTANLVDPSIASGAPTISVQQVPVRLFTNNTSYANTYGLIFRYNLQDSTHNGTSLVQNSTFWNNATGITAPYAEHTTFRNINIINGLSVDTKEGINGNTSTKHMVYQDLNISGYFAGIVPPRQGSVTITGGNYSNVHDILIYTAGVEGRNMLITNFPTTLKVTSVINTGAWGFVDATTFFAHDSIVLNYGLFRNQRLYFEAQKANYIPFPVPRSDMPSQYIGLTNQELWNQFGVALGGEIAPATAIAYPNIIGLVLPPVGSGAEEEVVSNRPSSSLSLNPSCG